MGRSAYLCPQESCLRAARQKNRLGRSLKAAVPPEIYDRLWKRLAAKNSTVANELTFRLELAKMEKDIDG